MAEWFDEARRLLETIATTQAAPIERASRLCADAIAVEEMFPRYGSYPGFHPLVELSTTFHTQVVGANGQRQAMFIERVSGLAEAILANFRLEPPDAMMVFSAGGRGRLGIEMADGPGGEASR